MTRLELEQLVSETLPSLRKTLLKTELDNDFLTETLWVITQDSESLVMCSAKSFQQLVASYFYRRKWVYNRRVHRAHMYGDLIGDYLLKLGGSQVLDDSIDKHIEDNEQLTDPWNNQLTEALEYIQFVPNRRVRQMMYQHYIEGYTLTEIAVTQGHGMVPSTVYKQLQHAIAFIKEYIKEGVIS